MTAALNFCMAALLCLLRPAARADLRGASDTLGFSSRVRDFLQSLTSTQRETLLLAVSLGLGLLGIPPLIWLAGNALLGSYAHDGLRSLFTDFFKGLAAGSPAFWIAALGPYALVLLARALYSRVFSRRASSAGSETAAATEKVKSTRKTPTIGEL